MNNNEIIDKHIIQGISTIRMSTKTNSRALKIARTVCQSLTPDERNILVNELQNHS